MYRRSACVQTFRPLLLAAAAVATAFAAALGSARGDVVVPKSARVRNKPPGYCAWCSLETLAKAARAKHPRDAGVAAASRLVAVRSALVGASPVATRDPGEATPDIVRRQLTDLGIRFRERPEGEKDVAFLRDCCDRGTGVVVGMTDMIARGESHAIAIVSISKEKKTFRQGDLVETDYAVTYVDSNSPESDYYATLTWVLARWSGWAVSLDPEGLGDGPKVAPAAATPGATPPRPATPSPSPSATPDASPKATTAAAEALVAALMRGGMSRADAVRAANLLAAPPGERRPPPKVPTIPRAVPGKDVP